MITSAVTIGSKSFTRTLSDKRHYIASLRAAQEAVHSYPEKPENWVLLATAALARSVCTETKYASDTAISTARLALVKGAIIPLCVAICPSLVLLVFWCFINTSLSSLSY